MSKRSKNVVDSLSSDSSDSEEEWTASASNKKSSNAGKKRARLQHSDSEPEEGEVSSGEDVYNDEDDDDDDLENDGLDENLIGDDEDKKRLEKMSEKEREEELFKRAERRDAMLARRAVKKKLKERKEKEKAEKAAAASNESKKQSSAVTAQSSKYADVFGSDSGDESDGSVGVRTTDRKKALEKKKEANSTKFQDLIAKRQQKQQKALIKTSEVFSDDDEDDDRRESSSSSDSSLSESSQMHRNSVKQKIVKPRVRSGSISSSTSEGSGASDRGRSSDSDSSSRGDRMARKREAEKKARPVETLEELSKIRLSRHKLEQWVHMPFFKEVVNGCFVRINIGNNQGVPIYRCAEIVDVVETVKIYDLGTTRTNKGLNLKIGNAIQMFRLMFVSNQDFSNSEFASWHRKMHEDGLKPPSLDFVDKKLQAIKMAQGYIIKDEKELDNIIESKKRFQKAPNNFAMRKSELLKLKEIADTQGESETARQHAEELDELESKADRIFRRRSAGIKSITSINQRNRMLTLSQAEEARKRELDEEEAMETTGGDPFNRLQTRPVMINNQMREKMRLKREKENSQSGKKTGDSTSDPSPSGAAPATTSTDNTSADTAGLMLPPPSVNKPEKAVVEPVDTSLHDIHNFEINIDLEDVPFAATSGGAGASATTLTADGSSGGVSAGSGPGIMGLSQNRRSLNLAEYKKRKGLI